MRKFVLSLLFCLLLQVPGAFAQDLGSFVLTCTFSNGIGLQNEGGRITPFKDEQGIVFDLVIQADNKALLKGNAGIAEVRWEANDYEITFFQFTDADIATLTSTTTVILDKNQISKDGLLSAIHSRQLIVKNKSLNYMSTGFMGMCKPGKINK